ncbi:MAG TPA: hypothetical protein DCW68_03695 [Rhodospirillaceae bacterium]|nr:MAG: hypothetical protein A2018_07775 [Alphaproteobacteria bacterium GWF2_58_20]HAU29197.1 hypothetical protein [Rhodospirillaceae bacterium]
MVFRMRSSGNVVLGFLLVALTVAQGGLGYLLRKVPPHYHTLSAPPGHQAFVAQTLGDPQFGFRMAGLRLQHEGNLDGRILPYKSMDYKRLADWFSLLDRMDATSSVTPTMAAFLFVSSQTPEDTRYLVDYLERHAMRDPQHKWRWLAQAVHIAWYRLGDRDRSLGLAKELADLPVSDLPYWARQMQVFILMDLGEKPSARAILEKIAETDHNLPENERLWMQRFIQRHLSD